MLLLYVAHFLPKYNGQKLAHYAQQQNPERYAGRAAIDARETSEHT